VFTLPAIGIDLGGTDIKGAVVSDSGDILIQDKVPTHPESGAEGVADRISELALSLCKTHGTPLSEIAGIGVGVPGVTRKDGTVVIAPNLNWHHVPFKRFLADRLQEASVELDNDANVAALAEARAGVGEGCESLALLTLGTGIGGGIVINGRVHHGSSYSAGEIGHMVVVPDGPLCGCGKSGCLEAISATKGMVNFAQQMLDDGTSSTLSQLDQLTPKTICDAAASGDQVGQATVDHVARHIGIAVANLINILSPDVIAIGGGISAAGSLILDPIVESARTNTLEGMFEHTRIELARLGNDAGSIGAAYLVM
jgi:glucokinase